MVDYYRWTIETAEKLRRHDFESLDLDMLIDEVEDLGKAVRRELRNRLAVLLCHLLKWRYQEVKRSKSWRTTIDEQRLEIEEELEESPSLRPCLPALIDKAYPKAVLIASRQTGFDPSKFPAQCPYTVEDILSGDLP
jgi:hypothetical protein